MLLNKIASFRVIENVGHRLLPNISILQKKYNELSTEKVDAEDKDISKAMKAYLTRAKEHEEFMKRENYEYQIGKRHLANMMGEDPETFTQEDVDNAIAYLFPSGIYDKKARPVMKPPEEIFPQRKAAEFDKSGRPFHYLFYTSRPNFYQLLHTIVENVRQLNKFEDSMNKKGILPDSNLTLDLTGYQWLDKNELESLLLESIGEKDYESFVLAIENLYKLPYSYRIQEFIKNI
ncbi:hypothetical protein HHI36_018560 [Cryptolaemus montrouzieri]|uniref:Mitochondrial ribosomal protein S9 n=1 Tax=Cryptolaemus montrouzieri TaxID=559131 RepID=A0ABD2P0A3_9CUCU